MFVNDLFKLIENSNEEYYAVYNQRGKPMIMRKPAGKTAQAYAEVKNLTIKGGPFDSHQETESFWIRNVLPTKKEQGVSEGSSIDDRIKGRIQNIVRELSDVPGYWDWQRDTFTPYGVEALASTLKNNKQYIKYALSLTSDDYYADDLKEQGVDENSLNEFLDDRNKDDDDGGDGRGRKSPKARARAQVLKMYGDGDITFRKTSNGGYFIQHEDDVGDTHSHQYDPQTGRVDFSSVTRSSYYGEGVAEGSQEQSYFYDFAELYNHPNEASHPDPIQALELVAGQYNDPRSVAIDIIKFAKAHPQELRDSAVKNAVYQLARSLKQGVAEGLNEFAPGGGGGGSWYSDDQLYDIIGEDWLEAFDVSGDRGNIDLNGERARLFLAQEAEAWLTDRGYRVNVLDVKDDGDELSWYIQGALYRGLAEGGFDIPEIPRAPQPRPEPKNKSVGEGFDDLDRFMKAKYGSKPSGGAGIKRGTYGQPGRARGRKKGEPSGAFHQGGGSDIPHNVDFDRSHSERSAGRRMPRFSDDYDSIKRSEVDEGFDDNSLHTSYVQSNRTVTNKDGKDRLSDRTASLSTDRSGNQRVRAIDGDKITIDTNIPKGVNVKMVPQQGDADIDEGSVQDKLHKRHQELRKKRGAPDTEYYRELKATFDLPDEERFAKAAELKKKYKVSEARKSEVNFDIEDIKKLERIRDLPTLKAQALALISKPSERPMKPEKVAWFDAALDRMDSPLKIIKLMYDLLLSGEGHQVIGSKRSMNPNSYRGRFGESSDGSIKYEFTLANGKKDYQTSKPAKAGDKAAVDIIGAKTIYKANNPLQKIKSIRVVDKPKDEESKIKNEDRERYIEELERAGYEIVTESATLCPECGGAAYADQMLAEKQDACYHKVKSRYKVWPSAYASGALVRCRKKGAANWGNKSKK